MSILADLVVTSATAAFAHFGVTMEAPERPPAPVERSVSRTQPVKPKALKSDDCPDKAGKPKVVAALA